MFDFQISTTSSFSYASYRHKCNTTLDDEIGGKTKTKGAPEQDLAREQVNFVHYEVNYTLNLLLAADLEGFYVGCFGDIDISNEENQIPSAILFGKEAKPHPATGGLIINHYFAFGCLQGNLTSTSCVKSHWAMDVFILRSRFGSHGIGKSRASNRMRGAT